MKSLIIWIMTLKITLYFKHMIFVVNILKSQVNPKFPLSLELLGLRNEENSESNKVS